MRKMALAGIILAIIVIVLGAYTRLTDAGPVSYTHLTLPTNREV